MMSDLGIRRVSLLITTLAAFLTPFDISAVNIALPTIGKELSMDAISLNWVSTAYLLTSAVFLVPFGRIADIYGRKRIFLYGVAIFSATSLVVPFSNSSTMLILLRIIQGFGGSMMAATLIAVLSSTFPPGERGRVFGINSAAIYTGLTVGPFLGGLMTQYLGWRSIFLVNVPLGFITVLLIFWKLKAEWCDAKGESFDLVGSILFGLTLTSTIYGLSILPSLVGGLLILAGVLGILAFFVYEGKLKSPVLNVKLFRGNRVFIFSNISALINYSSTFAVTFLLSIYLQYVKGLSPQFAGTILLCQPIVQAILSPFTGRLSDRIEPRIVSSAGMAVTCTSLFLLTFIGQETNLLLVAGNLALLGCGLALFVSPNTNAIMSSVENKFLGVASGTLASMRQIGQTLSMGITLLTFALFIGHTQILPSYYSAFLTSTQVLFSVFAILCFVGIFSSLARGRMHR